MAEKITSAIVDELYPIVDASLKKNSNKLKTTIGRFINKNYELLYATAPYDVIYYTPSDVRDFFNALNIEEQSVKNILRHCYWWDQPLNPQCAKEPYVETCMMAIRYYLKNGKQKEAELTGTYLAFSGKIYASVFTGIAFPVAPPSKYKTVMDYVVNNMLSDKYDLRTKGSVFGAVYSKIQSWLEAYKTKLCGHATDEDMKNIVQQLRDRIKDFLMKIAVLYYEAKENGNYLNYENDNLSQDNFHLSDNDSLRAERYTQNAVTYMTTNAVSLQICNQCKDSNIKATEIKGIMESILGNKEYIQDLYTVCNILICDFIKNYPKKTLGIDFVSNSMKMRSNTKDKYWITLKETILRWLDENSPAYRKRKSRKATAISYYKAVLLYITLSIVKANQ